MIKKLLLNCLILLLSILSTSAAGLPLSFERFQYNDKLPSNSVIRTFNDNDGYMWFGTKDGLCRFDGYDVKVFRSSAFTPGILTNNEIQCIAEDKNQRIWVGTFEGINIIDLVAEKTNVLASKSEARRTLKENALSINKTKITEDYICTDSDLLNNKYILIQKGKKNYYLIIVK